MSTLKERANRELTCLERTTSSDPALLKRRIRVISTLLAEIERLEQDKAALREALGDMVKGAEIEHANSGYGSRVPDLVQADAKARKALEATT